MKNFLQQNILQKILSSPNALLWMNIVLIVPLMATLLFTSYYIPGLDETFQIQAAHHLAHHQGFTSARDAQIIDVAKPEFLYMNAWPIGYSGVLALLMSIGMSLNTACVFFMIFSYILGLWGWHTAGTIILHTRRGQVLFVLGVLLLLVTWGVYATTTLTWSIMAWLTVAVLRYEVAYRASGSRMTKKVALRLIGVSTLLSAMIVMRYSNVAILPGIGLFLLWLHRTRWTHIIGSGLTVGLMPVATYQIIMFTNRLLSGSGAFTDGMTLQYRGFSFIWFVEALRALYLEAPLRLETTLSVVMQKLGMVEIYPIVSLMAGVCCFIATLWAIWVLRSDRTSQTLSVWFGSVLAGLLLILLGYMMMFLQSANHAQGRYYAFLFPVVWLIIVAFVEVRQIRFFQSTTILVSLGIIVFASISLYSVFRYRLYQEYHFKYAKADALIRSVRQQFPADTRSFVIAQRLFPGLVGIQAYYPTIVDPTRLPLLRASQTTLVILAHDTKPRDMQWGNGLDNFDEVVQRYGLSTQQDGDIRIAYRVLSAGESVANTWHSTQSLPSP